MTDPAGASDEQWQRFWVKWPLTHLTKNGGLFELTDDRIVPRFAVDEDLGDAFDAMVAEVIEWRLAEYLLRDKSQGNAAIRCRVSHSDGRPIVFLDRGQHPNLPEGWTEFEAGGEILRGNFVKVALNVAEREGEKGNALHDLLRGWFGPAAGHPGTNHAVVLRATSDGWEMTPEAAAASSDATVIPLFPSYEVACGSFETPAIEGDGLQTALFPVSGVTIDPGRQFVVFARGDSMNGGHDPVEQGDPLLCEWARDRTRSDLADERVLVQLSDRDGVTATLKRLQRTSTGWELASDAPGHDAIPGSPEMRIVATLVRKLDQRSINPLADQIGETHTRQHVPAFFGEDFSFGKWGQSGHITAGNNEILYVTLNKEGMGQGSEYDDRLEGRDRLVWSSQNATSPETPKGQRILGSPNNGQLVHLWARAENSTPFTYCGLVVPLSHRGAKPMSVTFRLLSPLSVDLAQRLLADRD